MEVGTALVIALTVVVGRAMPVNDHGDDLDVCGNACDYNQFCDVADGTCLECTLCVTSEHCTSDDCPGQDLETQSTAPEIIITKSNQPLVTRKASPLHIETSNSTHEATELLESISPSGYDNDNDGGGKASDKNSAKEGEEEGGKDYLFTFLLSVSGALVVCCFGAYVYFFHPLGCRSKEIIKEREQTARMISEGIGNEEFSKVPLSCILQVDGSTKSMVCRHKDLTHES